MRKNETQFYSNSNQQQNDSIKLKCPKSRNDNIVKFNYSRSLCFKNKNKTTSDFNSYKNGQISNYDSQEISNKTKELVKNDVNFISNKKTGVINSVISDKTFLRRIKSKNVKNKFFESKSCDEKNNSSNIDWFDKTQIKKRTIDFVKNKFLLGQINHYKRLIEKDEFNFSSSYSKKVNLNLKKNQKSTSFDLDKLKLFLERNERNLSLMKDKKENSSIFSLKNLSNILNKQKISKIDNFSSMKIKNNNMFHSLNNSNGVLYEHKNNIFNQKYYLIEKSKEDNEIKNYKSKEIKKIIDDNYNEYLKGISISDSNISHSEIKNVDNKNQKAFIKKIKPSNNKLTSSDNENEIYQYKKRLNNYNFSRIIIKNNKILFKLKKIIANQRKNWEDISKCITIEKPVSKKKTYIIKKLFKINNI